VTTGITHTTPANANFGPLGSAAWDDIHVLTESGGQSLTFGSINDGQGIKRSGTVLQGYTLNTLTESGGQVLTMGAINDGQGIKRAGTALIGYAINVPSDVVYAAAPNTDFDLTNGGVGGAVTIVSQSIAGIVAGDTVFVDLWYTTLNNSGSARSYTLNVSLGGGLSMGNNPQSINANATSRAGARLLAFFAVTNSGLASMGARSETTGTNPAAGGTWSGTGTLHGWNNSTSDFTGSQTFLFTISSNSTTTTQTATLNSVVIRKMSAT